MMPLYRLEKLPRTQRLRKIAKYFSAAENRLYTEKSLRIFSASELLIFFEIVKLLRKDKLFSPAAAGLLNEAAIVFEQSIYTEHQSSTNFDAIMRALNSVKHLLLNETGKDQADWDFTGSDGKLDASGRKVFEGMAVYLEDIRSPFNVGAMFRTAESFGVEKIFLSPFCADPHHRRAERTAMGCIDIVPWERFDNIAKELPKDIPVFALETGGIPIAEFPFPTKGLLIAGSEELGVSPQALAAADASLGRVSISTYGVKASLNVSVAFGIALQAWSLFLRRVYAK